MPLRARPRMKMTPSHSQANSGPFCVSGCLCGGLSQVGFRLRREDTRLRPVDPRRSECQNLACAK